MNAQWTAHDYEVWCRNEPPRFYITTHPDNAEYRSLMERLFESTRDENGEIPTVDLRELMANDELNIEELMDRMYEINKARMAKNQPIVRQPRKEKTMRIEIQEKDGPLLVNLESPIVPGIGDQIWVPEGGEAVRVTVVMVTWNITKTEMPDFQAIIENRETTIKKDTRYDLSDVVVEVKRI